MSSLLHHVTAACLLLILLAAQAWAQEKQIGQVVTPAPSAAYEVTLTKCLDGQYDLVLILFHRDGAVVHGYALVPGRDRLAHRIDPSPAAPIEYILPDGTKFAPPTRLKGDYDYKNADFLTYREQYAAGKLIMRNYDIPAPITVNEHGMQGVVDVFVLLPDRPGPGGSGAKAQNLRIVLDAPRQGNGYAGTYSAWQYDGRDETFGVGAPRVNGQAVGRLLPDYWQPSAESAFAPGTDWPWAGGPNYNGSAVDSPRELVSNIRDARLVWVVDVALPNGRGGAPRSPFGFFPINGNGDGGLGDGGFGAPVVADGKVYLYVYYPDPKALAQINGLQQNPRVIRGADPRFVGNEYDTLRDTLFCFDARTGRTLWQYTGPDLFSAARTGKGGRGLTPCVINGMVVFRGNEALYGLDAQTGVCKWRTNGPGRKAGYNYGTTGSIWSRDESPVAIDGVVVLKVSDGTALAGIDPQTGKELWYRPKVTGTASVPTAVILEGKPYIMASYSLGNTKVQDSQGKLTLIEPTTGAVVWESAAIGLNPLQPLVWQDVIAGNVLREAAASQKQPAMRVGGIRASPTGATPLWQAPTIAYPGERALPIAHHGHFFIDSRETGFVCLDAATGKIIARYPHIYTMTGGDHNWTWEIASNDRVITSGLLLFTLGHDTFTQQPGCLPVDIANGYMCPIKPAMADGRLIMRTFDKLVCYDLRTPVEERVDTIALTADDATLGMPPGQGGARVQFRLVNGQLAEGAAMLPNFAGNGGPLAFPWTGPGSLTWPSFTTEGVTLTDRALTGAAMVQVGYHHEPWTFELTREGGTTFSGTYVRNIQPLTTPRPVAGAITGDRRAFPDGRLRYLLTLDKSITKDTALQALYLVVDKTPAGEWRAHGAAGSITQAGYEVDCRGLTITEESITGEVTVILHSDIYGHPNPDTDGPLAARYAIKATVADDKLTGTYTGTIGIAWKTTGRIAGTLRPNRDYGE